MKVDLSGNRAEHDRNSISCRHKRLYKEDLEFLTLSGGRNKKT